MFMKLMTEEILLKSDISLADVWLVGSLEEESSSPNVCFQLPDSKTQNVLKKDTEMDIVLIDYLRYEDFL